jgi:hypothetical protein
MLGDMTADTKTREMEMLSEVKTMKKELTDVKHMNKFVFVISCS